jgi:parallel beta-helix repeat protein
VEGGGEHLLRDNVTEGNGTGIRLVDSSEARVSGNHVVNNADHGVVVQSFATTITRNVLSGNGGAGVFVRDPSAATVLSSNNFVNNAGGAGGGNCGLTVRHGSSAVNAERNLLGPRAGAGRRSR